MSTFIVADVGNSRLKWGLCDSGSVIHAAALPLDDPAAWTAQLAAWPPPRQQWILTGVNPQGIGRLQNWLQTQGENTRVLSSSQHLPLQVAVAHPAGVGMDRLLNAVAANHRDRAGCPAILVDAGSAVTVDWVDAAGVFRGGTIFPGLRLMARALNQYTAKLPLVEVTDSTPPVLGTNTTAAITAGIHGAVVGGISYLAEQLTLNLRHENPREPLVYLTGGDAVLLAPALEPALQRLRLPLEVWPLMTLEGIRLAATRLP
jgi:type III pantothenate kinase